jgi:3-mercaptopyruvate sulfurtransferase SseA
MRLYISLALATVLGAVVLTACNSKDRAGSSAASSSPIASSTPANPPSDGARRITTAELQNLLARNQAIVIDTRNEGSFKAGHIKGARLIPATEILAHADELPRDKMIVTYCA